MAATIIPGQTYWSMQRDSDGHRNYTIRHKIRVSDTLDGPSVAMTAPGLPEPGDAWIVDNENDPFAICTFVATVTPIREGQPNEYFLIEHTFSTRPFNTCEEEDIANPLLQPDEISGTFIKYMEEATENYTGDPIRYSSHEQIRGPEVEFDNNRSQIRVKQNVLDLEFNLIDSFVDTVNYNILWGFQPRCIKLSNFTWAAKYYGTCFKYYERYLEFDTNKKTFDRYILDQGTKVINGHWKGAVEGEVESDEWILDEIAGLPPDPANPAHFIQAADRRGNPMNVVLDGNGAPFIPTSALPLTVVPGVTCAAAPEIRIGRLYGPFTLPGAEFHFFKFKANNYQVIRIVSAPVNIDPVSPNLIVNLLAQDCGPTFMSLLPPRTEANVMRVTAIRTPVLAAQIGFNLPRHPDEFEIVSISNLFIGDVEYYLMIEGYAPESKPHKILVQYYPERNFLLLNPPLTF